MSPALRVLLTLLAVVLALVAAAVVSVVFIWIFGPSFNEYDEINECIGCQNPENWCRGCEYNPEYWDRTTYKGPSSRELRKIRKETRT